MSSVGVYHLLAPAMIDTLDATAYHLRADDVIAALASDTRQGLTAELPFGHGNGAGCSSP